MDMNSGSRGYFSAQWIKLPRAIQFIIINVLVAVLYFIGGKLGLQLAVLNKSVTLIWPASGIALAALLLVGYRALPAVFIGAFLVNFTTAGTLLTSLGIALGNSLEGFFAAFLINRFANGYKALRHSPDALRFAIFGACASVIAAVFGTTVLRLGGLMPTEVWFTTWLTWLLGDTAGIVLIGSLILSVHDAVVRRRDGTLLTPWTKNRFTEAFVFLVTLTFVEEFILFNGGFAASGLAAIPLLLLAAYRFGVLETILAAICLLGVMIWGIFSGTISSFVFTAAHVHSMVVLIQAFAVLMTPTVLSIAISVREQKIIQKKLENSHDEIATILEDMADAFVELDGAWRFSYVNKAAEKILQYNREAYIGKVIWDVLPGLVGTEIEKQFRYAAEAKQEIDFEYVNRLGKAYTIHIHPTNKKITAYFRDITEVKKREGRLKKAILKASQEKAKEAAMLASVGESMLVVDKDRKIILANQVAERLLGRVANEIIGLNIYDVVTLADEKGNPVPLASRPLQLALETEQKVTSEEYYIVKKNGERFPGIIIATPVIFQGAVIGGIQIIRDITKEKELDRAKSEIISLASHQLRTPLSIVSLYTQFLLRDESKERLSSQQQQYLEEIANGNKRMVELVNALLNVGKIEAGALIGTGALINPVQEAKEIAEETRRQCAGKKITFSARITNGLPSLHFNQAHFQIVLTNLLGNAVKYTPPGGKVSFSMKRDTVASDRLVIKVSDTGYGIPSEQQPYIFTKMFRAKNVRDTIPDGSGLGLYIVKSVVEKSGGSIRFTSQEGKGTTFWVELPLMEAEVGNKVKKVLVVEDEAPLRRAVVEFLKEAGAHPLEATNGKEGYEVALREHPDVILLDILLPEMDGVTMLKNLREDEWGKSAMVVMLTNVLDEAKRAEAMQYGAQGFLVKSDIDYTSMLNKLLATKTPSAP